MVARVTSPTFVGRRQELLRVATVVDGARHGRGAATLVVAGEAGVGKTRFLSECTALALATGFRVIEGGCLRLGGEGLPFGPIVAALRDLTGQMSQQEFRVLLGDESSELRRLLPGAPEPALERSGEGRVRLNEQLLLLLRRLAAEKPLLFVVEDIQWADRSTLEVIGFLVRNLRDEPVLLIATYRTDELERQDPLPQFVAELSRGSQSERIELNRFDRRELGDLLEGVVGARPADELVSRIHLRSGGNAFLAEELLAVDAPDGALPDSLLALLLTRLYALSAPAHELLRFASACGGYITAQLLSEASGLGRDIVLASLREAVRHHLLVAGPVSGRYAFRHALLQEAIQADLLPDEWRQLHGALAEAISTSQARAPDAARASELAYHWREAGDLPRAFDASVQAGIASAGIFAFAEAQANFERAIELWDRVPDAQRRGPLDRIELLVQAARSADGVAPTQALAHVQTAIDLVDAQANPSRAGRLRQQLATYTWRAFDGIQATQISRHAVELVPREPPSVARAEVVGGLARRLAIADHHTESAPLAEEAHRLATAIGDRNYSGLSLVTMGVDAAARGDVEAGVAAIRRGRDLSAEAGNEEDALMSSYWLPLVLLEGGRFDEAIATGLDVAAHAERRGFAARVGGVVLGCVAEALLALGRWDEAAQVLGRAERYEQHAIGEFRIEERLTALEAARGDFGSAGRRASRLRARARTTIDPMFFAPYVAAVAELALWQNDPLAARALVAEGVANVSAAPDVWIGHVGSLCALGLRAEADLAGGALAGISEAATRRVRDQGASLLAVMRSGSSDARARHQYYEPQAAAWLVLCEAEMERLEGNSDADRWTSAAAEWEALGMPYPSAYALMREGEAAVARGRNRTRAARALTMAQVIAVELGASPLARAVRAVADRSRLPIEAVPPGASQAIAGATGRGGADDANIPLARTSTTGRIGLTSREREVLALVAQGQTDGQIALALRISKKTAAVHVSNIKGKLGVDSRVEIATSAIRLGLVEAPSGTR